MEIIPGQKYQHYKGGLYEVVGLAREEATLELQVVYRALYDSPEFGPNALWIRPLENFTGFVDQNGRAMPRFSPL